MPRGVAVGAEDGHAGDELGIPVQQPPPVARQVEVLLVVEGGEKGRRVVGVGVLVLLDDQLRLGEERGAPRVVEVQVREDHRVHAAGLEADRVQPVDQEIVVREAGEGIGAQEARHGPGGQAGVEENRRVGGLDQVARDNDLSFFPRPLVVEEAASLEAEEAVLEGVEGLDRHAADYGTAP